MTDKVAQKLLKEGIYLMYRSGFISVEMKDETCNYINEINDFGMLDLGFLDFDQDLSSNCTFNETTQEISATDPDTNMELVTRELNEIYSSLIHGLKLLSTVETDVSFLMSRNNGESFYLISSYSPINGRTPETPEVGNLNPPKIRLKVISSSAIIKRLMVTFEKTEN